MIEIYFWLNCIQKKKKEKKNHFSSGTYGLQSQCKKKNGQGFHQLQGFHTVHYPFFFLRVNCLDYSEDNNSFKRLLTSCLRSSSDSPAQRYRCCSNSYRVVLVTTATFEGLKPPSACKAPLHTPVWWKYRRPLPLITATTGFREQRNVLKKGSVILTTNVWNSSGSVQKCRKQENKKEDCRDPE